ncbi:MAG: alpha-galactosidase [Bacteroidales bacterium]|nr:alpha-galactosidase [Bacteroidales bacterium]
MNILKFQDNNYLTVFENGSYDLKLGKTSLTQCFPTVDNTCACKYNVNVEMQGDVISASYTRDEYTINLTWQVINDVLTLKTKLTNIQPNSVEKLCVFKNAYISGIEKFLAHGYFSWDQSFLRNADELETAEANGVLALLNKKESVFVGYLTHDKMFQTFNLAAEGNQVKVASEMYLEGKDLNGVSEVEFSDIVFFTHKSLDEGQKVWADIVVKENDVKLTKPTSKGWCSWYYDYFWFSGEIIERHLEKFAPYKDDLGFDSFVIDANHFEHLGDWLIPDSKFPKGMEYYAQEITKAGYIPGIWIGPWMVADRSRVFKEHKDWLCKDENGELIEFMNPLGEDNVWAYRSKIHYCLDTSHPEAFEYLRNVFRTLRKWGYKYFKTDFMFWGSMDRFEGGWMHDGINAHNLIPNKEDRPLIKRHTPGKTRMEYFVDVLKMIREEIGEESIWLGCGQPIWASIGYVDCMRVSRDVGARWVAHNSPKELLNDLALRNFANQRFYEVDPDCVLLRTWETKITETEATSLALYMGVAQGMVLTSDYVDECPKHRLEIFKFIQAENDKIEFYPPLLGRDTDLVVYVGRRKDNGMGVIFFFNNGEVPQDKTYKLDAIDMDGYTKAVEWRNEDAVVSLDGEISVSLEPHASTLFYLKDSDFEKGWKPAKISG